jgi:hypothetical protein
MVSDEGSSLTHSIIVKMPGKKVWFDTAWPLFLGGFGQDDRKAGITSQGSLGNGTLDLRPNIGKPFKCRSIHFDAG